ARCVGSELSPLAALEHRSACQPLESRESGSPRLARPPPIPSKGRRSARWIRALVCLFRESGLRSKPFVALEIYALPVLTVEEGKHRDFGPCACCGGTTRSIWGYVSKDGVAYAVYYAQWTRDQPKHGGTWLVSIGGWADEDETVR